MKLTYLNFLSWLPGIEKPVQRLNFKKRVMWTIAMLVAFFLMSEITVWGTADAARGRFAFLETVLGSTIGSLMTLGIGPIVTASIILQLLNGSGLIKMDTSTAQGRAIYQGTQKLLAVAFAFFEAFAFVVFGAIPPASASTFVMGAVVLQLAMGGVITILMDEVVSKWGIGSGISLFIAAGVSRQIFINAFNFVGTHGSIQALGIIPTAITQFIAGSPKDAMLALIPILFTVVVFFFVVYAQAMKVEIPLSLGTMRGFGHRYPLKLLYTSNIPVILTSALLANVQLWANLLQSRGTPILGTIDAQGVATSGLISWISPPHQVPFSTILIAALDPGISVSPQAWHWLSYSVFLIVSSIVFALFWVNTSNLDAGAVAKRLHNIGLGVPGFRSDVRIIERVLERYIPALTVLSGALIGLLAAFADFTGALGTGTGILLTVMIIYSLYEQIAQQYMEDMHPMLRKFMGGS
ncbi:MAG: preprotein translocase subunit SecY [Candidatus Aenigmarchaeota archaeon]|nr:preprotein translocase subunit SecY [Candidatus Aenigmarchaeota archaeon]